MALPLVGLAARFIASSGRLLSQAGRVARRIDIDTPAGIKLDTRIAVDVRHNYGEVARWLGDIQKQTRFATSKALNLTANSVRDELKAEMRSVFDRPTPYVINSLRVLSYSRRDNLTAEIGPSLSRLKGVDPGKVLEAEVFGGQRRLKASERALQRAGILPNGYYTAPGDAAPLDAFGNVKGSFIVQLLSYFQSFGEQGYSANMTSRRKAQLAKRGKSERGYATVRGVQYFVAYGKLRGGKGGHLAPGIWARSGIHGSDVKPVLMFVRAPNYKPRFQVARVGQRVVARTYPGNFDRAFAEAIRTARPPGQPR